MKYNPETRYVTLATDNYSAEFLRRYQPEEVLGEGGMGFVIRAQDRELQRPVAIKFLRTALARDRVSMERFRREARAMAGISHPNVVRIFDHGTCRDMPYAVYELVEGLDLREWLRKHRRMPAARAIDVAVQVLEGLGAAHAKGIVHRDIKPGNVLLTGDGTAKVADFGIARVSAGNQLTAGGVVLGTPGYVAPEQFRGKTADARADIYATGALLYELICGEPPFAGEDTASILGLQAKGPPEPLDGKAADLPPGLAALVTASLDPDPDVRPSTASELASRLRAIAEQRPNAPAPTMRMDSKAVSAFLTPVTRALPAKPIPAARADRRPLFAGLAAAVLVAAGAWYSSRPAPPMPAPVTVAEKPKPAPPPERVVVVSHERTQVSQDRVRVRFFTGSPIRASVRAHPRGTGPVRDSGPGPSTIEHDLMVGDLAPATSYELSIVPAEADVRIALEEPIAPVTTLKAGEVEHLARAVGGYRDNLVTTVATAGWLLASIRATGDARLTQVLLDLYSHVGKLGGHERRRQVLHAIAQMATAKEEEFLLKVFEEGLPGTREWECRFPLLGLLGSATPKSAARVLQLCAGLADGDPACKREWVVELLTRLAERSPEATGLLARAAAGKDVPMARLAARALADAPQSIRWRAAESVGALRQATDATVRDYLLQWAAYSPETLREIVPDAIDWTPRRVGTRAMQVAGTLASPELVAVVLQQNQETGRARIRRHGLRLLGRLGGPKAARYLESMLDSSDAISAAQAAVGLADAGAVASLPAIVALLAKPDQTYDPIWVAAGWLAGLEGASADAREKARAAMLAEVNNPGSRRRWLAAWGLGRAGRSQDWDVLEALARSSREVDALRAFEGLWFLDRSRLGALVPQVRGKELDGDLEDQLEVLREAARKEHVRLQLFVPYESSSMRLLPDARAGEALWLGATGILSHEGKEAAEEMMARCGHVYRRLDKWPGLALDDGWLVVQTGTQDDAEATRVSYVQGPLGWAVIFRGQ